MTTVGLIGARGHTGAELLRLIARRGDLELIYASSRARAGEAVEGAGLAYEALDPETAAARRADAVILALPNGEAAPWAAAIRQQRSDAVIVDLSADHRFDPDWVYGLPEIYGRETIRTARAIANPGCYATAGQLCVAPVRDRLSGPAHMFGVSGYSGAGTTPSRKNDPEALRDNLMPYGLVGHMHEREMSRHLGVGVRFSPHVASFFRGIVVTAQLEFGEPQSPDGVKRAYREAYDGEPLVRVQTGVPEIRDGALHPGAALGGLTLSEDGRRGVIVCALDNLLKGAAVQALQNIALALDLDEFAGLTPW